MVIFQLFIIFLFGLAVGSFLGAYTYRWPKGIKATKGRSFCPKCKKKIVWYDNIPLLSYFLLKGKCRSCKRKISIHYPLIELGTALIFVGVFYYLNNWATSFKSLSLQAGYSIYFTLPYLLFIASTMIAIFIIDFENQIIPDELIFVPLVVVFTALILFAPEKLYLSIFTGLTASLFLLLIHLFTRGRGMGLGDVKLALFGGLFFSWPQTYVWLFLSFIIGAVVGILLLALKKAKLGVPIAFGPFLILSFFITLFWGENLVPFISPFIQ